MNNKSGQAEVRSETEESLLWQIIDAAKELESRLETELAKVGLSLAKGSVLRTLGEANEPLSLSELADENCCVRSNITQLVDRLETDGLVRRVNDPDDRRITRAALTIAGRKAYEDAIKVVLIQEQAVEGLLTPEETAVLSQALKKLSA